MRKVVRALALCGLTLSVGPLSLGAQAQGYVDVESERASASKSAAPPPDTATLPEADPYSSTPAKTYPATSYGLNSSAAPAAPLPAVRPPIGGQSGDQNLGNLFFQLQQLQQEVMMLNGKVEEQAHELRRLREQNLERYVDIDRRLGEVGSNTADSPTKGTGGSTGVITGRPQVGGEATVAEMPGEGEAYRAAYAMVRDQRFDNAVSAFRQFLQDYPAGKYAPNAHYWLGELYLVIDPADLESSRQSFMLLLGQYPNNSKIPDALYKLGKVQYMKGNRDKAREFFDRVINEYGSTNSSAVNLARDFLRENY